LLGIVEQQMPLVAGHTAALRTVWLSPVVARSNRARRTVWPAHGSRQVDACGPSDAPAASNG